MPKYDPEVRLVMNPSLSILTDFLIHTLAKSMVQRKKKVFWSFRWKGTKSRRCPGFGKKVHIARSQLLLVDGEGQYMSGIALKYGSVDNGLWASISGSMINLSRYCGKRLI